MRRTLEPGLAALATLGQLYSPAHDVSPSVSVHDIAVLRGWGSSRARRPRDLLMSRTGIIRGVLFDLDGTLLDTAQDMGAALNALLTEHGLPVLPHEKIRPHVSRGSRALVTLGFGAAAMPDEHAPRIERFLALYSQALAVATQPFDGVLPLLEALEARKIPWGIVTNKPSRLAQPLLHSLELLTRAAVVVCGDTLPERKPSPLPLLHASQKLGLVPSQCLFVGDAELDMRAARAAGMPAIGVRYGYFDAIVDRPEEWPADGWIESPLGLLEWLQ